MKTNIHNGICAWDLSSLCYVYESIKNVEKYLAEHLGGWCKIPPRYENPFSIGYLPDIDEYPAWEPFMESYYQYQIGIMRWMVELGRIDINAEDSFLEYKL